MLEMQPSPSTSIRAGQGLPSSWLERVDSSGLYATAPQATSQRQPWRALLMSFMCGDGSGMARHRDRLPACLGDDAVEHCALHNGVVNAMGAVAVLGFLAWVHHTFNVALYVAAITPHTLYICILACCHARYLPPGSLTSCSHSVAALPCAASRRSHLYLNFIKLF